MKRKRIRIRTIAIFALAALTGGLLLRTSQSVQQAEEKLAQLKASVQQEQDSIRLLNAEWAYLNNPERLEKLSAQYLDLMPPQPAAIISGSDMVPAKSEEVLSAISSKPQPVSFQSQNFSALLKNIKKGAAQ